MIRREPFGGLVFEEDTHKVFTLDRPSFRLVELYFISGLDIESTRTILRNEMDYEATIKEIEQFIGRLEQKFGLQSLQQQRGFKDDNIWVHEWHGQYFSAPVSNFWTFTNLCNLQCTHCAWNSKTPLLGELDAKECCDLIDDMHTMGVCELSFSGGEPLTKKEQLLVMAAYATKKNFHLCLATNATLVTNEVADELLHAGINEVQISVEGLEAHESIRGRGVWRKTVEGIKIFRQKNFEITFAVAINKTNFNELDNIFTIAKSESVKNVRFVRFIPIGRGKRNMSQFKFSLEEEFELAGILWRKRWELYPDIVITFNKHYVSLGVMKNPQLGNIPQETFAWNWDCPSARSRICIMPQGKVAPCPLIGSLGLDGGNIKNQSLQDIWENSEFFQYVRTDKRQHNAKCANCVLWAKCAGGCKASSYAHTHQLMSPDPLCLHNFSYKEEVCYASSG